MHSRAGCVLVNERIVRLANHLVNVLHGPARELAKEERKKEEERRKKAEQDAKEVAERLEKERRAQAEEEERKRKEEEKEKAEQEAHAGAEAPPGQASMDVDSEPTEEVPDDVAEVMNLARSLAAGLAVPSTSGSTPAATSRQGTPTAPSGDAPAAAGEAAAPVASGSGEAPQQERVTVLVHGEEVDITDTGIDREFLEALPDDMRDEVIRQHLRETRIRSTGPPPAVPEHINSEFLDALPPALRDEVLRQEAAAQRRAQGPPAAADPATDRADEPANFAEVNPADFLGTLDPALRSAVLSAEQGNAPNPLDAILGGLLAGTRGRRGPPANAALQAVGGQAGLDRGGPAPGPGQPGAKKPAPHRDVIQLLDKSGLATLVRLLFFPQPLKRNSLQRVLVNLCENSRTRVELVHLLLSILQDGTRDVSAVDKSFSQMSLRASRALASKETPKRKAPETPGGSLPHFPGESVPNLVAQRCLEALAFLVQANEQTSLYFLTEQEVPVSKRAAKKGKGKEKVSLPGPAPHALLVDAFSVGGADDHIPDYRTSRTAGAIVDPQDTGDDGRDHDAPRTDHALPRLD